MPVHSFQEIEISSDFLQAKQVEDAIVDQALALGYNEENIFALRLSLEEAITNAIRHGNTQDITKKVRIRYAAGNDKIEIYIADEGKGFDPSAVPDPTMEDKLECPSGRGIMLMRAYMDFLEYNALGNEVHLVKHKCA
jgi:serine/threonine-protein kinase RsbW